MSLVYLDFVGAMRCVTKGVSCSEMSTIQVWEQSFENDQRPYLKFTQVFRNNKGSDFFPVDHIRAVLREVTHRASAVSFIVATIDLLSR